MVGNISYILEYDCAYYCDVDEGAVISLLGGPLALFVVLISLHDGPKGNLKECAHIFCRDIFFHGDECILTFSQWRTDTVF